MLREADGKGVKSLFEKAKVNAAGGPGGTAGSYPRSFSPTSTWSECRSGPRKRSTWQRRRRRRRTSEMVWVLDPALSFAGPVKDGGTIVALVSPGCWGPMITPDYPSGHEVTRPSEGPEGPEPGWAGHPAGPGGPPGHREAPAGGLDGSRGSSCRQVRLRPGGGVAATLDASSSGTRLVTRAFRRPLLLRVFTFVKSALMPNGTRVGEHRRSTPN